jgi:hypothetical protein
MQHSAFLALRALQAPIPRLPRAKDNKASYVLSWTIRTLMLTLMDKEGVRTLTLDTGMSAWSFCNMWTDEQHYLRNLDFALRPSSVADMLERCGYRGGRPELLSCLACFAGDKAWDGLEKFKQLLELWRHALRK